jgi:hypothetical protein
MAWIPFGYRDFWEVPRLIVCTVAGREILLDSPYDEATNSYAPVYQVYRMPAIPLQGQEPPPDDDPELVGTLAVEALEFDATRRQELESGPILTLLRKQSVG